MITSEHAEIVAKKLEEMRCYLNRLVVRLEAHGFDQTHQTYQRAIRTRNELAALLGTFQHLATKSNHVYRGRKNPIVD